MSLFRSRLFRWLAQSWAVQWGRQTRQRLERPLHQLETWVSQRAAAVMAQVQPAIAPAWQAARKLLLPAAVEPLPPLLWLEGLPSESPPKSIERRFRSPRRLAAGVRVRLVKVWRSLQPRWDGNLAPPAATLDRRVPRKSFAEILAEAIAYYFGRAQPSLAAAVGLDGGLNLERGATVAAPGEMVPPVAEVPPSPPVLETQAVFLGYAYGPLVEFLLRLDRWVERIENFCLRIWRWLRQWRWA